MSLKTKHGGLINAEFEKCIQNQWGGWRGGREVGSAGVGWRDGEKRHTTVIE